MPRSTVASWRRGCGDLARGRAVRARRELGGLLERAADEEDERDDGAAEEERDPPARALELLGRHQLRQGQPDAAGEDDRDLLAGRLPADVEALVPRRRDLGQVDRDAAELDAGGEALQEPPGDDQHGREESDRLVARHDRDRERADRHQRQRQQEPAAPPDVVDVGAEDDRAERPHQEPGAERHEREHRARRTRCPSGRRRGRWPRRSSRRP